LKKVMAVEAEEEVSLELEARVAVCSDDCRVLRDLPPHLVVHMPPRTAADSSQQVQE
jgi:E3 ubiquitin-protein ligase RNF25